MTRRRRRAAQAALACLALLSPACGGADEEPAEIASEPVALADQEDAVCGMLVREQSAPRAQLVHRDGSRFFFCSIGDMLVHLSAPSPHGRVREIFVEVLDAGQDPRASHTGEHPWSRSGEVTFVVGVARPGIMGPPVLAYSDSSSAARVVDAHPGAVAMGFDALGDWWKQLQAR